MKKLTFIALLIAGFASMALTAQQAARPVAAPGPTNFVADDDGGVVQIIPVGAAVAGPRKAAARPVMQSVQQVSVFLGHAWSDQDVRTRETALLDLAAGAGSSQFAELHKHNTKVLPAAPAVEDFTDLSQTTVNDLTIQSRLLDLLDRKILPAPDAGTVFVVFLAPGIKSTLGGQTGGIDYAAYHSLVHHDGPVIHYVVVPFNEDPDQVANAAARAIVETAFNPTSN
jgi:hypothetical protein